MSYIRKKGIAAVESALSEGNTYNRPKKVMFPLKSGTSVKVRILSLDDIAEVWVHSVYESVTSTPCTQNDYYDQAVRILYDLGTEEARKLANALRAKPRYLMGFVNLDTGEPIIVDLSKKQAQGVLSTVKKYKNKLNKLAFELAKNGMGQSTTVTLNVLIDLEEDLTVEQRKHFEASKGMKIPEELYESCLYMKNPSEQIADIRELERKYKIQILDKMKTSSEHIQSEEPEPVELSDDDLPF